MSDKPITADIRQEVLLRSWTDPEFRDLALRDPRAALASLGYEVPEDLQIVPLIHRANVLHLEIAAGDEPESHPAGATFSAAADDGEIRAEKNDSGGFICTFTRECSTTCWPGLTKYCSSTPRAC